MKYALTIFICALFIIISPAQTLLRFVGTNDVGKRIGLEDTKYYANRVAVEQQAEDFKYYGREKSVTIPVVFHVIFSDSVKVTAEQINC